MEQTKIYQAMMSMLCRHSRPDEQLVKDLIPLVKLRAYDAKEIFTTRSEIPTRIAYIIEGAAVAYRYKPEGRRLATLWRSEELIIDTANILKPHKSDLDIVFLCDSQVIEINLKQLYQFREEHLDISPYFAYFLSLEIRKLKDYICLLKTKSAEERVRYFQQQYKLHNMLLPDEQKAQYLGMSLRWYQSRK